MKFILFLLLPFFYHPDAISSNKLIGGSESADQVISLSREDQIIAENLVAIIKLTEKSYINHDLLIKVISETEKSKNFQFFVQWLKEILFISKITNLPEYLNYCRQYIYPKENLAVEKYLERLAGNYCREKTLEEISRDIDKSQKLNQDSLSFIQLNLKYYVRKKNRKNFAFFLRTHGNKKDIFQTLSREITSYSVRNEIIPSQDVLKDIEMNEQITSLIQDKGFNPLHHQNVFYLEFGKLIEQGYKLVESKSPEDKLGEHFYFIKNFFNLNRDHLPINLSLTRLNDFSKSVFRNGYEPLSREMFKFVIGMNNKETKEDALFFLLWTYLFKNDFKQAQKVAHSFNLIKNSSLLQDTRLKFWLAYTQEKLNEKDEAISLYEDLVINSPLNYYAIMASKKLQSAKPDSKAATFYTKSMSPQNNHNMLNIHELDSDHISSLIRLRAWATIGFSKLVKREISRLKNHSMPSFLVKNRTEKQFQLQSELHLVNSKIIQQSQNYLEAFRYLYQILENKEVIFNRGLLEVLYPAPYMEILVKNLDKEPLDPIVLLALIRQESVFNPQARSRVGATGLMQLMPNTAKRFKRYVKDQELREPTTNVEIGIKYFNTLMKRYDGNLVYVLSAYNAGEARVERWKNQYFDSEETILKNIEAIPFLETRNYVKLIFRNIFFYKLMTEQEESIADSKEINKIYDIHLGFNN
jgi:soluble lytic murein transglycosylase